MERKICRRLHKLILGASMQKQHMKFESLSFDVIMTFIRQMDEDMVHLEKENWCRWCKKR
ncbi:hypothetical protein PsorP6_009755 [Peronosclerospora sorghi]|uniref:Uncharacterized protein n=1 Tax=Peronosclerospora sorghi TaxID=230839 RepID=A0ACC0W0B0_9STRA|nr:hypothetical protein PsorP6_009755 [Peronosclerospora sorghi]